jgi:hypothetical protein
VSVRPAATADLSEARRLLGAGLRLVKMKPFTKQPDGMEWNQHPVTSIDPNATGYGLLLAQNKLCSIDPDNGEVARIGMAALGFDLDQLMEAGARTRSTRPGSGGRSTFAADGDIGRLVFKCANFGTVIEFRAEQSNLQDTVPGIVYRDKDGNLCRQEYGNHRRLDDAPPLPDELLEWWERCSTDLEFLNKQEELFFAAVAARFGETPKAIKPLPAISTSRGDAKKLKFDAPGFRGPFNRKHTVPSIIERHGYEYHPKLKRWSCPTATGAPGVHPVPGHDGLWSSDHASDALHGRFDAWVAHVVLDHGGDLDAAIRANPPPLLPEAPKAHEDDPGYAAEDDAGPEQRGSDKPRAEARERPRGADAAPGDTGDKPAIVLRHAADIVAEQRAPRWLAPSLHRILERGVLAVIAGQRGTFKSFVALDWCMRAALDGGRVIILSGEGAGLDRRIDAWMRTHAPDRALAELQVLALERPLNLAAEKELVALIEAIEESGAPAAILIDTFSKFAAGVDENDNAEVATYLSRLSRGLRERFDCTVLLVAHAGHGDARRPRGASALMANPDAEYIIERSPPAMVCTVTRERFKDYPSMEPLAYQAEVIDLGRVDEYGERVTSLVMRTTDAPPVRAHRAGANQTRALTALREWMRTHPEARFITSGDIADLLKAQGIDRRRRPDALNYLVNAGVLTNSIGGYTLNRDMA